MFDGGGLGAGEGLEAEEVSLRERDGIFSVFYRILGSWNDVVG